MADNYVANINIGFSDTKPPEHSRLLQALDGAGWRYVGRSAMAYEGDLVHVLLALEVLARSASKAGRLSTLTVQVQRVESGRTLRTPGPERPVNALSIALQRPLPSALL